MPSRFGPEIVEFLRVSGPTTSEGLVRHFAKWGADPEALREALAELLRDGSIQVETTGGERYRVTGTTAAGPEP